jgi:DNA-binding MarR family transcriptional regulator
MADDYVNLPIPGDQCEESQRLLFALLAGAVSDEMVAETAKVPEAAVCAIRKTAALAVAPNPEQFAELIADIGEWQELSKQAPFLFDGPFARYGIDEHIIVNPSNGLAGGPVKGTEAVAISRLEAVSRGMSPSAMRTLASRLMKLADSIDQQWDPTSVRAKYHWTTRVGKIERNAVQLARTAMRVREQGRRRERYLPTELLGEPAWQMLLELFVQFAGGAQVSTKSLCVVSGIPDTTALRLIDKLEETGLIVRCASQTDKRVTLVELTRDGVVAVGNALMDLDC